VRSERWLTRRAARGDREAFAAIFSRHQQDLYRYCVAILGDPDDAQDALQNTMVKALRALPGERREIALKPWLYRIAHNEAIELRRRERPAVPLADVELPAGASLEDLAAERWRLRELLADLGTLPLRQRGALVMRELAGFDFEQIAIALETTPAAARQVLYEARRGLREMTEGHEMRCDEVTAILSDGDGRVARRRDLRAHLRDCPVCRAFAEEIRSRGETLAAAAMVKGAVAAGGGAAAAGAGATTGAGAGGTAAIGGSAAAGGAGIAAGAAAKAGSTAAIVKSAIGIVAIAAVGAVAADQTHLVHLGGSGGEAPAAHSTGAGNSAGRSSHKSQAGDERSLRVSEAHVAFHRSRGRIGTRPAPRGTGLAERGTDRGARAATNPDLTTTDRSAEIVAATADADQGAASTRRQARGADHSASVAGTVHPQHPAHPAHPDHPLHPAHPTRTDNGRGPAKSKDPTAGSAGAEHVKTAAPGADPAAADDKSDPPAPTASTGAKPAPSEAPPGQAGKEAQEEEPAS
jgi:RNA polymerase sigma factor (sigma-70 family)